MSRLWTDQLWRKRRGHPRGCPSNCLLHVNADGQTQYLAGDTEVSRGPQGCRFMHLDHSKHKIHNVSFLANQTCFIPPTDRLGFYIERNEVGDPFSFRWSARSSIWSRGHQRITLLAGWYTSVSLWVLCIMQFEAVFTARCRLCVIIVNHLARWRGRRLLSAVKRLRRHLMPNSLLSLCTGVRGGCAADGMLFWCRMDRYWFDRFNMRMFHATLDLITV